MVWPRSTRGDFENLVHFASQNRSIADAERVPLPGSWRYRLRSASLRRNFGCGETSPQAFGWSGRQP